MSSKNPIFIVVILATLSSDFTVGLTKDDRANDNFEFTRVEPGNELGITTKVIAHIHRPAKKITETWRLNREFTPEQVMKTLYDMCSDEPIVHVVNHLKIIFKTQTLYSWTQFATFISLLFRLYGFRKARLSGITVPLAMKV